MIGRRYALVGGVNFALLAVFALTEGILGGFGPPLNAECALLPLLFGLVAVQGAFSAGVSRRWRRPNADRGYRGGRVVRAQAAESLQRLSLKVSWVGLPVSAAVPALAANGLGEGNNIERSVRNTH